MGQDDGHPTAEPPEVTLQLRRFEDGDEQARAELMPVMEPELRRLAAWQMRGERDPYTLQTTALVNEAYIRLFGLGGADFNGRKHFLAVASRVMRQVLVESRTDAARGEKSRGQRVARFRRSGLHADATGPAGRTSGAGGTRGHRSKTGPIGRVEVLRRALAR